MKWGYVNYHFLHHYINYCKKAELSHGNTNLVKTSLLGSRSCTICPYGNLEHSITCTKCTTSWLQEMSPRSKLFEV
jgi:hypothetical protein